MVRGWQRTDKGKKKIRIEDIVQDAAEKFGKSDVTIKSASAAPRRLNRGDVDLLHAHHRIKCALCFFAAGG
jgi:hypothetical protein